MENKINIGELDTLVTIRSYTQTRGSQGELVMNYADHSQVYAKVERRASEFIANTNLDEGRSIELTIYKIAALTTRWRAVVDGVTYEIVSIDTISRVSPLCILSLQAIDNG